MNLLQVQSHEKTRIRRRSQEFATCKADSLTPPFPKTVLVEISNLCNHRCVFCAYSKMTRPGKRIDLQLLDRLLREAYDLGSCEAGFYSGAEPFTSPDLEAVIKLAKQIGYKYVYVSTNGSLATEGRLQACIDNGLDSIKFSINAGDREAYKKIHGHDHFDRVIRNLRFASEYRRVRNPDLYIAVSFVLIDEPGNSNIATRDNLTRLIGDLVDELVFVNAMNQSGQMIGLAPMDIEPPCSLPFGRVHISAEGHLRMCCNDYQNYLSLVDLHDTTLMKAWNGDLFQEMRRRHLEDRLEGMLCYNCVYNMNTPIRPVVPALAVDVHQTFFEFQPSGSQPEAP